MSKARAVVHLEDEARTSAALEWVEGAGYEAIKADDLRELGRRCDEAQPAVVIVEGPLGDQRAVEAIQWLRRGGMGASVVFMCGSNTEGRALAQVKWLEPYAACHSFDGQALGRILEMIAPQAPVGQLPRSGELADVGLEKVLMECLRTGFSGQCHLERQGTTKTIYMRDGKPVYCSSSILTENFGQILLRKGLITEIEYNWARKLQQREGIRQGEALVKIGVLKHEALFEHLREQIREKIINAFGWDGGQYRLEADEQALHDVTHFGFNPIELMVEGGHRFEAKGEAQARWRAASRRWAVRSFDSSAVSRAVERWLPESVKEALEHPCSLHALAEREGWPQSYAGVIFGVLDQAGYLEQSSSQDALPASVRAQEHDWMAHEPGSMDMHFEEAEDNETLDHDAIEEMSENLWKAYLRLTSADHFEALGVDPSASVEAIEVARDDLLEICSARRFRPVLDDGRSRDALRGIRSKIRKAAQTLLDPDQRARYEESLKPEQPPEAQRDRYLSAEDAFVAGMNVVEEDPRAACRYFSQASALNPSEAVYTMHHGWAMYRAAEGDEQREEARRQITAAVAANPLLDEGYAMLGQIYFEGGDVDEARDQAQAALIFNPTNGRASQLLEKVGADSAAASVSTTWMQ